MKRTNYQTQTANCVCDLNEALTRVARLADLEQLSTEETDEVELAMRVVKRQVEQLNAIGRPRVKHMFFEPIGTPFHTVPDDAQCYRVTNANNFSIEFYIRHDELEITSDLDHLSDFTMNLEEGEFDLCGGKDLYHICYDHGYEVVKERLTTYFRGVVA